MYKMPAISFYEMVNDPHSLPPVYWYGCVEEKLVNQHNMNDWIRENLTGNYEFNLKFNSGYPKYYYRFYDSKDAMLFKLTFLGVNNE